jgi:peroxiredoxin
VDFTLNDLEGKARALSDAQGRFVLLTFFATWCGPCASEMPSLEGLHRQAAGLDLAVIGVSIDDPGTDVAAFTRRKGASFPVVLDSQNQVASIYRATSIPVSFIIDPMGRIVGMARGARNWANMVPLFEALRDLASAQGLAQGGGQYQAPGASPVALPQVPNPPDATVRGPGQEPKVNQVFTVVVEMHWPGHFEDYIPNPPEIPLPEGVAHLGTRASASTAQGQRTVAYHIDLKALRAGRFALDPVELRYTPRQENQAMARRVQGVTVNVVPPGWFGIHPVLWALGALGVVVLWFVAIRIGRRLMGKSRTNAKTRGGRDGDRATDAERISQALAAAKRARLEGDLATALEALQQGFRAAAGGGEPPRTGDNAYAPGPGDGSAMAVDGHELTSLVERARYGGYRPSPEILDTLERRLARRVAEISPTGNKDELAAIELAKGHERGEVQR